jgi:NAD(P)H-dependent FMN reductase
MRVAIIIGSIREGRQSQKAAYFLQKKLAARLIDTDILDLAEYPLPFMEERITLDPNPPVNALLISEKLKNADAIILVTPEYQGSFTGVLKNALDYFLPEFLKKVVGVATTAGGRMGGINASVQLQHVILSMGAYPLPQKLIVSEIQNAFDEEFNPKQELLAKQGEKFVAEFVWFAQAIVNAKQIKIQKELI